MRRVSVRHKAVDALRRTVVIAFCTTLPVAGVGCGSPPSVLPLMEVVRNALTDEAARLEADGLRDARYAAQTRRMLDDAFAADLADTSSLTPAWVEEATAAYVVAREAVLRQELAWQAERTVRRDNLAAAAEAQGRAMTILAHQDRLLRKTLGLDLWRFNTSKETSR